MKNLLVLSCILIGSLAASAQNTFNAVVVAKDSFEPLIGATVLIKGTSKGAATDLQGQVSLSNVPNGKNTFVIQYTGFVSQELNLTFPQDDPDKVHRIELNATALDEVLVEATRANKSIKNLPTRIEVLTGEIDEAASMEPSRISHLLTHSTGIQVQTTSATSNGAVVRIQGLNGRYTQILMDGFPMFGGFSGSLDVLQIPPLDLRQVEYVKGSASTLYGGGAIAGLVNLLTKKPSADETLLHVNFSHIGSKDFNAFTSRRFGKWGFTNLANMHLHAAYDADEDGYSDVPEVMKFNFNPKLFFYPDAKSELYFGAAITREKRMGGDMDLIEHAIPDSMHYYYDRQESGRNTTQFMARRELGEYSTLTARNSISFFDRFIRIRRNAQGSISEFKGRQINSFSEINYNINRESQNVNMGLNVYTDNFTDRTSGVLYIRDQKQLMTGAYMNHLWDVTPTVSLESGLRFDNVAVGNKSNNDRTETFVLPRFSVLHKLTSHISIRGGGGMGYRMPTIFNEEAEPYGYSDIVGIDYGTTDAERSYGVNMDFKYQSIVDIGNMFLTLNQMFFYNVIDNPIVLSRATNANILYYSNIGESVNSQGFESQIKLTVGKLTWFFGYTYTDAFYLDDDNKENMLTLTPKHSIKGDFLFVVKNKWRLGWDYEFKSEQLLSTDLYSPTLFMTGILVERTINTFVIFLNAENFTDTRQTRHNSLLSGPNQTPQYTDVWAPLDGFFFNAGLKIKL